MGKESQIRRAVRKNPTDFFTSYGQERTARIFGIEKFCGKWVPLKYDWNESHYVPLIRSELIKLGYIQAKTEWREMVGKMGKYRYVDLKFILTGKVGSERSR